MMRSQREKKLETECNKLRSELNAMEQLIQRYQEELVAAKDKSYFNYNMKNVPDLYRVEEVMIENQELIPKECTNSSCLSRTELPALCRVNGEEAQFSEVTLPSQDWEWVSDWYCDIHASTDENGWVYAESWEVLRDINKMHRSKQSMDARVRQRRWKRERMLVQSTGLPVALNESLLTKSRLASMQYATEKLTQQLLRAHERIEELEHRGKIYETHMLKLQHVADGLLSDLCARSHEPVLVPHIITKSTDVLKQTEALLGDMLVEQGLARLDMLSMTNGVQRRRSEVLAACENELQSTIDEFNDRAHKFEQHKLPPSS